ncbi:Tyrosinase [Arthrobotrys entomopaga]|nr:Tyrosinase [Arthrobotrys entomopaga]
MIDLGDGRGPIPNPLYSYRLAKALKDLAGDEADHSKPEKYETVRYPLSGLVGARDIVNTMDYNNNCGDEAQNIKLLNTNVYNWLTGSIRITPDPAQPTRYPDTFSVFERFKRCLIAPNYNIFSNTSSQAYWINQAGQTDRNYFESLEGPHNAIHLAVGGFYVPGVYNADEILGANGDMGENDTAAFDPIFFSHHCWTDHVFWPWQKKNDRTTDLRLIRDYNDPGLNSDGIAGAPQGEMLNLDTKLYPFEYTSRQVTDINDLGYTYGSSSLFPYVFPGRGPLHLPLGGNLLGLVRAFGLSKDTISGSFVLEIYAVRGNDEILIHREAILSRWGIQGCLNCQNHLELNIFAPVHQDLLRIPGEGTWTYKSVVKDRKYSGIAKPKVSIRSSKMSPLTSGTAGAQVDFFEYS